MRAFFSKKRKNPYLTNFLTNSRRRVINKLWICGKRGEFSTVFPQGLKSVENGREFQLSKMWKALILLDFLGVFQQCWKPTKDETKRQKFVAVKENLLKFRFSTKFCGKVQKLRFLSFFAFVTQKCRAVMFYVELSTFCTKNLNCFSTF